MPSRRLLVVIPTYNERDNLEELFTGIRQYLPDADIQIVDDASPDGTAEWAEELGKRLGRVSVRRRPGKLGIGSAYRDAFREGLIQGYERLVSMDGDLSHEPQYLPALVEKTESADVAIGSRYMHGISVLNWDLHRLALSVGGNAYTRLVTGLPIKDCTSGFQCFRREVLERVDVGRLRSNGYGFLVELKFLAHRLGFRLAEVPIVFVDRRFGASKNGVATIFKSMWTVSTLPFWRH
ncbi:MAG: polyprenol monophosphomannose synthase [Deltaproteobacteria bacterium]|nr:polyprenol monophosphomannose synthase [Deltaproteobacteria bacterium]